MFIDRVRVRVKGGDGGSGCTSFLRLSKKPKLGPDGGDGGPGGNVTFVASRDVQSLEDLQHRQHVDAERGMHGSGNNKTGANGAHVIIKVPVGTVVKDLDAADPTEILADLARPGDTFIAARGGKGGRGNQNFVNSINQAPRRHDPGLPGQERMLELELKTVADVGLVGYPNAGKSTLLQAVSDARPAVAPYPFTTLNPHVGVIEFPDAFRMTMADLPGLIEGAHENVGLGIAFLRHIERTTVLLYVLDCAGIDGRLPWDDLKALKHELECYQKGLSKRPAIIAANKIDEAQGKENLKLLRRKTRLPIFPICAILGDGVPPLLERLRELAVEGRAAAVEALRHEPLVGVTTAAIVEEEEAAPRLPAIPPHKRPDAKPLTDPTDVTID